MKILLGDFNTKLGREVIFKPIAGIESLHQASKHNGVRIVNSATSKNLHVKSKMFTHHNIHRFTWTSPDGKTHNQIDNILIDWKWYSSILDVQSFRGADCDTDLYLKVAKVRETLAISKQAEQKFDVEILNLKKLSELEVIKQYQIKISKQVCNLENVNDGQDINRAWENTTDNIKT